MNLDGKKVLITGGGSGIGLALARALADRNEVIIAGRDETKLEGARAEIPKLRIRRLDVSSETEARGAMTWVTGELGGLDLLVNSAGLFRGYAVSSPQAELRGVEDVEVNLIGALRMTLLALPLLEASKESGVVFLSSAVALAAVPGYAVYAATKAAVHSFARSLRAELAGTHLRVFEVLAPVVDTGPAESIDVPKVSPVTVADAIVDGLRRDRQEIRIGPVRQLAPLARIAPRLADRLVQRALGAQG